ncbi:MAG: alpha/beta hydrolase, partial [Rhizobium sp.]|nr:alpha/beta hydrolase [Rhizobium sp.]
PALLLTSQDDPLLDETLLYGERLKSAGVEVRQNVLPPGTGWPSVYGGKTEETPSWQESASSEFAGFLRDICARRAELKTI